MTIFSDEPKDERPEGGETDPPPNPERDPSTASTRPENPETDREATEKAEDQIGRVAGH